MEPHHLLVLIEIYIITLTISYQNSTVQSSLSSGYWPHHTSINQIKVLHKRSSNAKSESTNKNDNKRLEILTILGLFELTQNGTPRINGISEKYAAELALQDINDKQIIKNYRLQLVTNDTKCDAGVGVDALFHALYTKKNLRIVSLLGSACSEVTERLAKVVPYWNLVQVSFGSTSPSLSDRKEFPLFYRTVSPVSAHNEAIVALIQHFGWDTVSFFTQNENRYTMPMNFLVTELEKANITCKATLTFSMGDLRPQLHQLKELDARIIIASFSLVMAPHLFCEVNKLGIFGRDYGWIVIGQPEVEERWWIPPLPNSVPPEIFHEPDCSYNALSETIENSILVDRHNWLVEEMDQSFSGMSVNEFQSKFELQSLPQSPYSPETYDAVWTIALALKSLLERTNEKRLGQFEPNGTRFATVLAKEMNNLNFTGISGPISFLGGDRIGITSFTQIHDREMSHVGLYFPKRALLSLNCSTCTGIRWHGGQIPIARREFRFKLVRVEARTYACISILGLIGIVMAFGFLLFNLYNRKLRYIKLSSPRLNNMVIIGSIFAYLAVILLELDTANEEKNSGRRNFAFICTIRVYLLSMGFSLAFGAMFAKTYRVHRIFTRSCIGVVKNKLLRDRQLMTLIMALLAIDCLIITSWEIINPMHWNLRNLTLEIDPSDRSVVYQQQIKICRSQNGHVWLSIVYGYKSLLLAVGLYMAWETRQVKIQALNDSKYIGFCVYIVVLTSILGVSLSNLLSDKVTISFLIVTTLILTSTTITLCLLFLPKIHAILKKSHLRDPIVESSGLKLECNTRRFMVEDTKELLFRAEVQNRVYKRQIAAIDIEMWRVEKLLTETRSLDSLNQVQKNPIVRINAPETDSISTGSSDNSSSEIYTVYLHGPRFIIPISLLNFRNGTKTITDLGSVAALAASALNSPRSSWPSTSTNPCRIDRKQLDQYRYTSAPKLLTVQDETPNYQRSINCPLSSNATSDGSQFLPDTTDSCMSTLVRTDTMSIRDSKSSGTSGGSKTSVFLSVLKFPFSYMTGLLKSPTEGTQDQPTEIVISPIKIQESSLDEAKANSVPELWGMRSSPCLDSIRNRKVQITGIVMDTRKDILHASSLEGLPSKALHANPILKLLPESTIPRTRSIPTSNSTYS